jgi:hypothetical protein
MCCLFASLSPPDAAVVYTAWCATALHSGRGSRRLCPAHGRPRCCLVELRELSGEQDVRRCRRRLVDLWSRGGLVPGDRLRRGLCGLYTRWCLGLCYAIGPQSAGCASLIPVQIGLHGCSVPGARKPKPTPRPELLCFENRNRKPKKPTFRLGSVRFSVSG